MESFLSEQKQANLVSMVKAHRNNIKTKTKAFQYLDFLVSLD
jgi:hypothetical protein